MRFAFIQRDHGPECVVSLAEYGWLQETPPPVFPVQPRPDPAAAPLHLLYGTFLAQPWLTADQAITALDRNGGQWLWHLQEGRMDALLLRGLHIDVPMVHGHATRVPFAVLVQLPAALEKAWEDPSRVVMVTPVDDESNPLASIFTRHGVLALLAQEQPHSPLVLDQWGRHVDVARLRRTADRIR